VWFTAYPASTIAASPGASVLTTLADERLWRAFEVIGIQGIHTGPMKRSGGVRGRAYTPSVDGNFDRISFEIDPAFGTETQYRAMVSAAAHHGAAVIGDIIPGHTGKGPDFRLAERAYADYPGIYHMVSIEPADWALLPPVPVGQVCGRWPPGKRSRRPSHEEAEHISEVMTGVCQKRQGMAEDAKDSLAHHKCTISHHPDREGGTK